MKYYSNEAIHAPLPECSLYEYLFNCNKEYLGDYALNYFGKKITYKEFFYLIDCAAKAFLEIGVREGDIVPVVSVSTVANTVCIYALNRIGAIVDPLNVLSEQNDLEKYFKEAKASYVISLDLFSKKVLEAAKACNIKRVVIFGVDHYMPRMTHALYYIKTGRKYTDWKSNPVAIGWDKFLELSLKQPKISYSKDPHKICFLAHTGGTTGEPKAVMLDDCAMNTIAAYYKSCFNYNRGEVWANVIIPFVVYGALTCLHVPLTLGLTTVLIPKFDTNNWKKYFSKYHINYILAAPPYVNVLCEKPEYRKLDLRDLKLCGVGGDGMTVDKEMSLNGYLKKQGASIEVLKGYGLSEVCATAVTGLFGVNKVGSVGIPLIHNNVMIYDNNHETEMSYHNIGEICIQSPSQMIGYMDNEKATKDLIRIHPDGSKWLHTGDLGYFDKDGFLFLAGRMKRMILTIKDGVTYKVAPNMSEKVLNEHEAVIQSCIVGADLGVDQLLHAFVVIPQEKMSQSENIRRELQKLCEEQLPSYARPSFYEFTTSLPLTAAGKIDYRSLEEASKTIINRLKMNNE